LDYCRAMRLLPIPYVFECAWRSFLPSQYNARLVLVDNPVNSVLAARLLATVGEICWAVQVSWALRTIARNVPLSRALPSTAFMHVFIRSWIPRLSHLLWIFAATAQVFSITGMVTTNYAFNVVEDTLWALNFLLAAVCALALWRFACDECASRLHDMGESIVFGAAALGQHHHDDSSVWVMRAFIRGVALFGMVATPYMVFGDIAHWYDKYLADQAAGKIYLSGSVGFADAAYRRVPTQVYADWQAEVFWMSGYFSLAVLSSIALMFAPGRVRMEECTCPLHEHGLVLVVA
jgi:hypothetical protein